MTGLCPKCRKRIRVSDMDAYASPVIADRHANRRGQPCDGFTLPPVSGSRR